MKRIHGQTPGQVVGQRQRGPGLAPIGAFVDAVLAAQEPVAAGVDRGRIVRIRRQAVGAVHEPALGPSVAAVITPEVPPVPDRVQDELARRAVRRHGQRRARLAGCGRIPRLAVAPPSPAVIFALEQTVGGGQRPDAVRRHGLRRHRPDTIHREALMLPAPAAAAIGGIADRPVEGAGKQAGGLPIAGHERQRLD